MGKDSTIEWCSHSFNPWWGCQRVSPGCEHCYAEAFAKRTGHRVWGPEKTTGRRLFGPKHWDEPLKWNTAAEKSGVRARVFCASMADVFEDNAEIVESRARLFALVKATPHLDWLLLTKRPENADRLWTAAQVDAFNGADSLSPTWLPNVWLGTTVEDQQRADERIPHLLRVPAAVRFLSCEPLLEEVKLGLLSIGGGEIAQCHCGHGHGFTRCPNTGGISPTCHRAGCDCSGFRRAPGWQGIDWVIVGGESGTGARPFDLAWARSLVAQCRAAGVAPLVKQLGANVAWDGISVPGEHWPTGTKSEERYGRLTSAEPAWRVRLRDSHGGDPSEWPEDLRVREFPEVNR